MEFKGVRTRFAPSPTGYMHVGNLRTALYTYLTAKHEDGTFILRIEDTDQGRYVEGAVDVIYDTLRETGLVWDEGPDVGGPVGPYVQSQRMGMFKEYAEQLVKLGKAYYCFCTEERWALCTRARRPQARLWAITTATAASCRPKRCGAFWTRARRMLSARKCPGRAKRPLTTLCTAISRWRTQSWRTRSC